jgi:hypothetical protein
MATVPTRETLELWLRANGAPWLVVRSGFWRRLVSDTAGAIGIIAFALQWLVGSVVRSRGALFGVLPLLLVAVVISFFSAEMWQTIGSLHGLPIILVFALLVALAWVFVAYQAKPDLDALASFAGPDEVHGALPGTFEWARNDGAPGASPEADSQPNSWTSPTLRRRERVNLLLVSALAQVIAAAVVGLAVAVFFVIFGLLTVSADVATSWIGEPARVLVRFALTGHEYAMTSQLLRVAGFLGTFSGFYLIVSSATDRRMRESVAGGHDEHLRAVLAVRAVYRGLIRS